MNLDAKPQILVVDDFEPMRRIYDRLFEQIGLDMPDVASGADEAIEKLSSNLYAVIISDWHMAGATGLQLLKRLRARPASSAIPFIMATAESRPESVRAAQEAGVTDYLIKPFTVGILKSALAKASVEVAVVITPVATKPIRVDSAYFRDLAPPPKHLTRADRDAPLLDSFPHR